MAVKHVYRDFVRNQLKKGQPAHIADASVAHALNAVFDDTEVEAALNALGTKINAILLALEANEIVADA